MNQEIPGINSNLDTTLNHEQFDQVLEAILAGKYSWACVLLLRFTGCNPVHYIPYRTYNRLLKENTQTRKSKQVSENLKLAKQAAEKRPDNVVPHSCLTKIKDLTYLEVVGGKQKTEIRGGSLQQWLATQIREYNSIKAELKPEKKQSFSWRFFDFN